jgi:molybdopterin-guanine dinucleotide biosynthesis protein A
VLGVVLTGGASRRMGRTKALIAVDGVALATRVAAAMEAVGCAPVCALGGDPVELAPLELAVIPDRWPGEGPLAGIIGALDLAVSHGLEDVMVLACDLPDIGPGQLQRLVDAADRSPSADVIVATTDRFESGCAIWRTSALGVLLEQFHGGERAVHRVFADLDVVEVALPAAALRNINAPGDLGRYP